MGILEAIILGIIQGIGEFLPISSSGHLEVLEALMAIESNDFLFSTAVHGGTALSILTVFWRRLKKILTTAFSRPLGKDDFFLLLVSALPVGVGGLLFEPAIEAFFKGNFLLIGVGFLLTSLLLGTAAHNKNGRSLHPGVVFCMGVAQLIALWPGVSRSGATISTALLMGVSRQRAVDFSFLMILVPVLGLCLLKATRFLLNPDAGVESTTLLPLCLGVLFSFVTGVVSCQYTRRLVTGGKLWYFSLYCFVVGGGVVIWSQIN